MSTYDGAPRWSDESAIDQDDTGEIAARRPLFENNFLQRWMERSEADNEADDDEDSGPFTTRFRKVFKRLFPKLAESKSEYRTEQSDHKEPISKTEAEAEMRSTITSEVEFRIPHEETARRVESQLEQKPAQTSKLEEQPDVMLTTEKFAEEALITAAHEARKEPTQALAESTPQENAIDEQNIEQETRAMPTESNEQNVFARAVGTTSEQAKFATDTANKSVETKEAKAKESVFDRLNSWRKERKIKQKIERLERQVKDMISERDKDRTKTPEEAERLLVTERIESAPLVAPPIPPYILEADKPKKREKITDQPIDRQHESQERDAQPTAPEAANRSEEIRREDKLNKESKPHETVKIYQEKIDPEKRLAERSSQEEIKDLEIVDDHIREIDFDKRYEIKDKAQRSPGAKQSTYVPPTELPPVEKESNRVTHISDVLSNDYANTRARKAGNSLNNYQNSVRYGFILAFVVGIISIIVWTLKV